MRAYRSFIAASLAIALAVGIVVTNSVSASVQSIVFNAEVKGEVKRPVGCEDGAFGCGEATIEGFGSAEYLLFLTGVEPTSTSCADYTAVATFALADGSTLTLDESGTVCGPGNSFFSTGGKNWGNPVDASGTWVVQDGTGQFSGMTGSGTNSIHNAGAHVSAVYIGTLDS